MSTNLPETTAPKPLFSNTTYDKLVALVQKGLPAAGALYAGLAIIWGFPNGEEVVGSLALLATFGGVLLGISNRRYNASEEKYDGALVIDDTDPTKDVYTFEVGTDLTQLKDKQDLVIKVQKPS